MKLLEYLEKTNSTIPKFAEVIGYSHTHIYNVLKKKTAPRKRFTTIVEQHTGGEVKAIDWIDLDELKNDLETDIKKLSEEAEYHA